MHVEDKDLVSTLSAQIEGSPLRSAVYARVDTPLGFTRWFTPIGNYLVARPAARVAALYAPVVKCATMPEEKCATKGCQNRTSTGLLDGVVSALRTGPSVATPT